MKSYLERLYGKLKGMNRRNREEGEETGKGRKGPEVVNKGGDVN